MRGSDSGAFSIEARKIRLALNNLKATEVHRIITFYSKQNKQCWGVNTFFHRLWLWLPLKRPGFLLPLKRPSSGSLELFLGYFIGSSSLYIGWTAPAPYKLFYRLQFLIKKILAPAPSKKVRLQALWLPAPALQQSE